MKDRHLPFFRRREKCTADYRGARPISYNQSLEVHEISYAVLDQQTMAMKNLP
jgi:hypothetical protein